MTSQTRLEVLQQAAQRHLDCAPETAFYHGISWLLCHLDGQTSLRLPGCDPSRVDDLVYDILICMGQDAQTVEHLRATAIHSRGRTS